MTPMHLNKYTSMLHELKELRAKLTERDIRISELEYELESTGRNARREDELDAKLKEMLKEHFYRFTKREKQILRLLVKKAPEHARHDEIMTWVYSGQIDGPPNDKIKDVYICKLRARFRLYNIPAAIVTVWGQGWRLEYPSDPSRSRVETSRSDLRRVKGHRTREMYSPRSATKILPQG